jgi:aminopeptidase
MDIYTERLAALITDYSLDVREGQQVNIIGSTLAEPLIKALYRRMLEHGAHPHIRVWLPGMDDIFFQVARDHQIDYISFIEQISVERFDAGVSIMSSPNTRSLTNIPAEKMARSHTAQKPLFEKFMERMNKKELKWCGTIFPTNAYAQDAEMSLEAYSQFLYRACQVTDDGYIDSWKKISAEQAKMVEYLKGKKDVHIRGVDTDLRFSIEGRPFVNCDGRENMPDGEIFTSPIEDSVEGKIRFSYPVCEGGREIEDIYLEFESGRVVKARARKNEDYLLKMLDTDEGARRVGEFGIGNNPGVDRFTRVILFDEKIRGTIHLALGLSFGESGGINKSAIHWDMICDLRDGGEIFIDGQLFGSDGKFCKAT